MKKPINDTPKEPAERKPLLTGQVGKWQGYQRGWGPVTREISFYDKK